MRVVNEEFTRFLKKVSAKRGAKKRFLQETIARVQLQRPALGLLVSRRKPRKATISVRWLSAFDGSKPTFRGAVKGAIAISGGQLKFRSN